MPADPSVEIFIRLLLSQAFDDQATELVIGGDADAARNSVPIRYRVAGVWYDMHPFPQEIRQRVLDRLWQMAGLAAEGGFPKHGAFTIPVAGRSAEWRVQINSVDSPWVLTPVSGASGPPSG